jgi:DNA-binding PadR family transcriptional regulator
MHGYEMTAFIEEEGLSDVCPVEQSTLYTYLRNIEARGLVTWTEERVGHRPPRKIFELTLAGRELVHGWLRRPVGRMREVRLELLIKLFFLDRLDPEGNRCLLADQVVACQAYLRGLDASPPRGAFQRLVLQSKRTAAEATLSWLQSYAGELQNEAVRP